MQAYTCSCPFALPMPTVTRRERIARSVLLTAAALVSAMILGIGYQQEMTGALQSSVALPLEEEFALEEPLPFLDVEDTASPDEPLVWCCAPDSGMCYEQASADGCREGATSYDTFDSCISSCSE